MARNDGIDRVSARNKPLKGKDVLNAQQHNEREKATYSNEDVVPERTPLNVHFKVPDGSYEQAFSNMVEQGIVSTRGLKADAVRFDELVLDVNSAYFHNHGGYEFAKKFYADAYKAAVQIVGGEQYVISAVMHADERNRAMSDALGQNVYHYHLHVVYVPVVEKQILWSKRCKDKSLVGTVKETVMQVSNSKKWASQPALDERGNQMKTSTGKAILKKSYSILQDQFFQMMRAAGYEDVERGEHGSSEEHLSVTQFKVMKEQERLTELTEQTAEKSQEAADLDQKIQRVQKQQLAVERVESIKAKSVPLTSKVILERSEYENLSTAAKKYVAQEKNEKRLQKLLDAANQLISELKSKVAELTAELSQYRSIVKRMDMGKLEAENRDLRRRLSGYESVIERYDLWHLFGRKRTKLVDRDEERKVS